MDVSKWVVPTPLVPSTPNILGKAKVVHLEDVSRGNVSRDRSWAGPQGCQGEDTGEGGIPPQAGRPGG
jgi:hypothetical protein